MFRFLRSEKGFTVVELAAVLIVLGILTAVAVPLFAVSLKSQKRKDCRNQALVVETLVQQAMYGMIDNGKKQETINIAAWADGGTLPKIQHNPADSLNIPSSYDYKYYTVFDKNLTLGDIRGHYWKDYGNLSYSEGCDNGHYLKKKAMDNALLYTFLSNGEFPVCPFDDPDSPQYKYVVFEDGSVFCTCPECNVTD